MALLAYALVRPRTPLVVWLHSEVIRPRWQYRLFYEPLLNLALRRAARIVVAVAADARRAVAGAAPGTSASWCRSALDPAPYAAAATADAAPVRAEPTRALRRAAGGLQGRGRAAAGAGRVPAFARRSSATARCRASLEALAAELGVADRVTFAGQVPDDERLDWYRAADLFVLPSVSRQEAFGMVQIEAMLSGLPS